MFRVSDLRYKDIINALDGKRLGYIRDVELDLLSGKIRAIIVPGETRFWGFFARNDDLIIPWDSIKRIGLDVVLVEVEHLDTIKRRFGSKYREEQEHAFNRLAGGDLAMEYDQEIEDILRE